MTTEPHPIKKKRNVPIASATSGGQERRSIVRLLPSIPAGWSPLTVPRKYGGAPMPEKAPQRWIAGGGTSRGAGKLATAAVGGIDVDDDPARIAAEGVGDRGIRNLDGRVAP